MTRAPARVSAPSAPGSLGRAPDSRQLLEYLPALLDWRDRQRQRLDDLDRRARSAVKGDALVADVTLAFALWQSISTRINAIVATWDGGRVGDHERERIAELLWSRLGGSVDVVLAVSFAEACVLADALTDRLAAQLDADPLGGHGVGERIAALRAQFARCRDHRPTPPVVATIDRLATELDAVVASAAGGADPKPDLERIESEAARLERDLIIEAATRSRIVTDAQDYKHRIAAAEANAAAVGELAERCREKIANPPAIAVPAPSALGSVPSTEGDWRTVRAELDAFEERLVLVERAVNEAEQRYRAPLARRDELRGLLDAYRAMAARRGYAEDAQLHTTYQQARSILWSAPLDLDAAAAAVATYEQAVRAATKGAQA